MPAIFEITTYMGQTDTGDAFTIAKNDWSEILQRHGKGTSSECQTRCSLLNHITGREIQHLLKVVVERVLAKYAPIDFLYCCNSDGERRFMMLEILPVNATTVEFRSRTLVKDRREHVPSADEAVSTPGELLRMCSWCKKLHADSWIEVEDAIRAYRLLEYRNVPLISHTICEDCRDTVIGSSHSKAEQAS